MCGCVYVFDRAAVVFPHSRLVLLKFVGRSNSGDRIPGPLGLRILAGLRLSDQILGAALVIGGRTKAFARFEDDYNRYKVFRLKIGIRAFRGLI